MGLKVIKLRDLYCIPYTAGDYQRCLRLQRCLLQSRIYSVKVSNLILDMEDAGLPVI